MTRTVTQLVNLISRIIVACAIALGVASSGQAFGQFAGRMDGNKAQSRPMTNRPNVQPVSQSIPPANSQPAPEANVHPAALVGMWHMQGGDRTNGVEIVWVMAGDGGYEQVIVMFQNGQRSEIREKGGWAADAKQLATSSEAGEKGLYDYQVSGNRLVVQFHLESQLRQLEFNRVDGQQRQPTPPNGQTNPRPNAQPTIVGNWHCQGNLEGSDVYIRATFGADGSLRIDMQIGTPQGQVNMNGQGTWRINGNVLEMRTNLGEERVPFEFRGETLFLDYSMAGFTLEMVRVTNGQ